MTNILKLLKSRQFWVLAALFVVNGIEGVKELVPAEIMPALNVILGVAAVLLRIFPVQDFAK